MKPIVEAIGANNDFIRYVIEISADRDLIRTARKILEMNNKAVDRVIEIREGARAE